MSYHRLCFIRIRSLGIFLGICLGALAGCSPVAPAQIPSLTPERLLTPYLTLTLSPTPHSTATPKVAQAPTEAPLPSPTPLIYTIVEGDTLTGVAFRHSVPLDDLVAANPGLDPNFLTIGLTLTIPLDGVVASVLPSATPIAIDIRPPSCYPIPDGSLHCLIVVENTQANAIENVVALVSLQSEDGQVFATTEALSPLNIIPAGEKAGLAAIFEGVSPQQAYASQASLLTVIPVAADDQRYLQTRLEYAQPVISVDGKQASLSGSLKLLSEQPDAANVWIAAFAYDENENIVGMRKWLASDVLVSGERIEFDFAVYSLGPPIHAVEIFAEARP